MGNVEYKFKLTGDSGSKIDKLGNITEEILSEIIGYLKEQEKEIEKIKERLNIKD